MPEEKRSGFSDGIRTGISMVTALKEALEETIEEAFERGDISRDRARRVVRDAADRIQATVEEAGGRFEMVPRRDFDALKQEVADLRDRLARLEGTDEPPASESGPADTIPVD